MGLYVVKCPQCDKEHLWFSGNDNQRCDVCNSFELNKEAEEIYEEAKGNSDVQNVSEYIIASHNFIKLLVARNNELEKELKEIN